MWEPCQNLTACQAANLLYLSAATPKNPVGWLFMWRWVALFGLILSRYFVIARYLNTLNAVASKPMP
jgi:hypothetical protein